MMPDLMARVLAVVSSFLRRDTSMAYGCRSALRDEWQSFSHACSRHVLRVMKPHSLACFALIGWLASKFEQVHAF
eukprot:5337618-Pleurochrysis_carterae.AAC.1